MRIRLLGLALLAFSGSVLADSNFGPYAGITAGNVRLDRDFNDFDSGFDAKDTGFSAYLGYQFTPSLAIEASYNDFGEFSELSDFGIIPTRFDAEIQGVDIFGVLSLPLGPLDLYGKAGVVFWDAETTAFAQNNSTNPVRLGRFEDDGANLALGAGGRVFLSDTLSLRGEVEWFDLEDAGTLSVISLGFSVHF